MHNYTKYFKEQKGFDRFMKKLYQKYQSLSKFSGTIKLNNLSQEEANVLSRLFGTHYQETENISLSVSKFITIMNHSKYEDFNINILVEEYLQTNLITKKENQNKLLQEEEKFYQSLIHNKTTQGNKWLQDTIIKKDNTYKILHQRYNKNKKSLQKELINIIKLINNLPSQPILLPIYASTYTKDPHYLDLDTPHSHLFFYALAHVDNSNYPTTREKKIQLLSKYNIEIDAISNFVITYNLLSNREGINDFSKQHEPLILNIQNIINTSHFDSKQKKVYIFENPSLLTEIISQNIDASVLIAGGFPNTSVYLLMDKLIENNNKLYYNGDLDPEGLIIAAKLKERYPNHLELICYQKIDYNNGISKKKITDSRLKKLTKITEVELLEIKELLQKHKYASYQENNKERLIKFIQEKRK